MANYDFLMALDKTVRLHADAVEAITSLAGTEDSLLEADNQKGTLSITCNGKGIRRDLSPKSGQGFMEAILFPDDVLLTLVIITPARDTYHYIANDASIFLGIQLNSATELTPALHAPDDSILYCGGMSEKGISNRVFPKGETFHAFSISTPLEPRNKVLHSHVPVLGGLISESIAELEDVGTFFTHFHATTQSQHCAHEMLFCNLAGQLRYDYLRAKANEFCCLFESYYARISDEKTSSVKRISQKDKEALFKIRENILKNPGGNLTIPTLAGEVGLSSNKTISLFKTFYGESIHQFVVRVRMEKAKTLLESSDMPILEICKLVDYRDQSGFGRAFRKIYDLLPSQIRRYTAK